MRAVPVDPLRGLCQERQRELQLGILVIVSGFQIYVKMNTGEDGITKSIVTLVGACLFLIGAFFVFPAFFGYRI